LSDLRLLLRRIGMECEHITSTAAALDAALAPCALPLPLTPNPRVYMHACAHSHGTLGAVRVCPSGASYSAAELMVGVSQVPGAEPPSRCCGRLQDVALRCDVL
jgi:hypothetical protein